MESYYDTIPNFRCWDVEAWKNYLREYVVPIYKTTTTLLELRDELLPYLGKSLKTVKDNDERLLPFFVGGIDENGNYKERSLAKLIRLMLGIYVEPREFASAVGEAGEKGLRAVRIKSEDEQKISFLRMIRNLNKVSGTVLQKVKIEPQQLPKVDEIVQDPNKLLDTLKEFYKACVSFSANHNYYTFFIVSTASIHWKYLATAYPKLKEHFDEIKEFLELEPIFVPNTSNEELWEEHTIWGELRKNYTILGHRKGGIANLLYRIQLVLWAFHDFDEYSLGYGKKTKEIFDYITPEPEDLTKEYVKLMKDTIGDKEEVMISGQKFYIRSDYELREISGFGISIWPNNVKLSLPEFLDKIAPWLFLGFSGLSKSERKSELNYIGGIPTGVKWWVK